jgi:hypothetical protein
MSAWLKITLDVDMELPDGTTTEFAEQVVTATKGRVMDALDAIDVTVEDWKLDP